MNDFPYQHICEQLTKSLHTVLSSRRHVHDIAIPLNGLSKQQIDFCLHWADVISHSNSELAYQFTQSAPLAIRLMDTQGCQAWILDLMDVYDRQGLYPSCKRINELETFAATYRLSHISVTLKEMWPVLNTIIRGLSGRQLKIASASRAYTDTEHIFLPPAINRYGTKNENYRLYKLTLIYLWAQNAYGTFKRPTIDSPHLHQRLRHISESPKLVDLFEKLETIRLNACIARDLAGIARQMKLVNPELPTHDSTWEYCLNQLNQSDANVETTLSLTQYLWNMGIEIPNLNFIYKGELAIEEVARTTDERLQQQQQRLNELIQAEQGVANSKSADNTPSKDNAQSTNTGTASSPTDEKNALLADVGQDIEHLPDEWLQYLELSEKAAKADTDNTSSQQQAANESQQKWFHYPEWDFKRQQYRQNWCRLQEKQSEPMMDDFVEETLGKYRYLVKTIRQKFEMLRADPKRLRSQKNGDEIDFNALVDALCDARRGGEMENRLYIDNRRQQRNVAVVFMLDMSGSTKGWINLAMRESLVLLIEALEKLGDQYAIYGFSGMTRNRCDIYKIKEFEQDYNNDIRHAISGIRAKDYTRMGPAIRHLTNKFNPVSASTKILITLSDGKPDDYDGYQGEYGIADTHRALLEAKTKGIHSFCITLDSKAADYLPRMYKDSNYIVIDDITKLPLKVTEIYRKIAA